MTSELTPAQCPHASPSPQREHSPFLFTQHDQRPSTAASDMILFGVSDNELMTAGNRGVPPTRLASVLLLQLLSHPLTALKKKDTSICLLWMGLWPHISARPQLSDGRRGRAIRPSRAEPHLHSLDAPTRRLDKRLHSMAVLQVFQAKMLANEEAGLDSASLRDLRSVTDLALRATKATAQAIGLSISSLLRVGEIEGTHARHDTTPSRSAKDPGPRSPWIRHLRNLPEQPGRKRRGPSLASAGPPRKQPLLYLSPHRLALGAEQSVFMDPHYRASVSDRCDSRQNETHTFSKREQKLFSAYHKRPAFMQPICTAVSISRVRTSTA